MEQYPLPEQDYKVLIRCYTFNHEKYIEETLKGFVMQKTDFPFVAVIVDDASTDGTADIIRKYEAQYPDIIKGVYLKENHYSQKKPKSKYIAPWRARCKYEALCEGDDFWTDSSKLQKQVEFLDNNPEYAMTCHRYQCYNQEENTLKKDNLEQYFNDKPGISFDLDYNFNTVWLTKTLTALVRTEAMLYYFSHTCKNGRDTAMFYYILKTGKGYCFNNFWGCYRLHSGGVYSKVSYSNKFYHSYLSYKNLYLKEKNQLLRNKVRKEYCNYVLVTPLSKHKIKPSADELLALFYYIPLKLIKRLYKLIMKK